MGDVARPNRILEIQHRWASIAQDIALTFSPQNGSNCEIDYDDICANYGITRSEFVHLLKMPVFKEMCKRTMDEAKSLGHKAGHVFRAEAMATALGEKLYAEAIAGDGELKDRIKLYSLFLETANYMGSKKEGEEGQKGTVVNITIPQLSNPKLAHLTEKVVEVSVDD